MRSSCGRENHASSDLGNEAVIIDFVVPAPYLHLDLKCLSNSTCMAADAATNSIEDLSSKSDRVAGEAAAAMMTMVQNVSKCEGKFPHVPPFRLVKELKPAGRIKLQRICKDKFRRSKAGRKLEGVPSSDCETPSPCCGTENRKSEDDALQLSAAEDVISGNERDRSLLSKESVPESIRSVNNSEFHVLAVDDSYIDRRIVERFLRASSYKVTTVDSALKALEYLGLSETCPTSLEPNKVAVDLIITDYCMPGMTGYEFLKIVKNDMSVCKEIPVIVMSSEDDSNRINRCLAEGAGAYIIKPVKMEDVEQLRGHIRSFASSAESSESSNSSIGFKRKSPECLQVRSPERRLRTSELLS